MKDDGPTASQRLAADHPETAARVVFATEEGPLIRNAWEVLTSVHGNALASALVDVEMTKAGREPFSWTAAHADDLPGYLRG